MTETDIQNAIRVAVSKDCIIFRTNAGKLWQGKVVWSKEFQQNVLINLRRVEGLPTGYSDLSGVRKSDGRAVFIEVKKPTGVVSEEQKKFIAAMQQCHAVAGVARSVEDALKLLEVVT
ncbi:MAG: VRR-NUC domain-containing protein [Oscillospiraceae bacterium]|nr:VRR-NUC domain-containing protein [Oscillospiraceae bacterium]